MAVQDRLYTDRDLAEMPDDGKIYELHSGVLVEVAGWEERESGPANLIFYLLNLNIMQHRLSGLVVGADWTFVLSAFNTRIPDVAYIHDAQGETGLHHGAPDLAVEVVSPSNTPLEMQQRAGKYIDAGTRLVWIVEPDLQTIDEYRADGTRRVLRVGDTLDGYDILPGLSLPVASIFNMFKQ